MIKSLILLTFIFFATCQSVCAQKGNIDSLKQEILSIRADIESINLNLEQSKSKFQRGILVATLGYSITIAGGLMLGRKNDELGQALLLTGGITGGVGTYLLVDSFKFLGRTRRRQN